MLHNSAVVSLKSALQYFIPCLDGEKCFVKPRKADDFQSPSRLTSVRVCRLGKEVAETEKFRKFSLSRNFRKEIQGPREISAGNQKSWRFFQTLNFNLENFENSHACTAR